jgi:hypothetical protein
MEYRHAVNVLIYFLVTQPIMFVLTWAVWEAPSSVGTGIQRLGYDFGGYIAVLVGFVWTASMIPAAYLVERYASPKLAGLVLRRVLVTVCALVSYASTFLFAYPIGLVPPMAVILLGGGAIYGALFRVKTVTPAIRS